MVACTIQSIVGDQDCPEVLIYWEGVEPADNEESKESFKEWNEEDFLEENNEIVICEPYEK